MDSGFGLGGSLGGPALPKGQNTKDSQTQTEFGQCQICVSFCGLLGDNWLFEFCHPANFAALLRLIQKMLRLTQGS